MPRECRNFNNIGKVSCLLVLLLAFLAVNPVMTSVYAENAEDNYSETSFGGSDGSNDSNDFNDGDDIATLDTTVSSTVGISFSPAKYYADLAPTNSTGQSARIDLQTTVYVSNSGGYSVYLKTDNPNLVGENNSNNFIPGATTAKTYTNMDVNTWGYAAAADVTSVPNNATYKAVIASGNGDKLAENTSDDIETDTKTIALSFATKINDQKPADTYSNTMMLSVVSTPAQAVIPWGDMTTMQEMTTRACRYADSNASKQLKDARDGKYYWVAKLPDNKCWMTQNLDLDLSTAPGETSTGAIKTFTNVDTDLNSITSWTPTSGTYSVASTDTTLADNTGQRSWSLGNYRITNPTASDSCGYPKNSAADCPSQFVAYNTPTTANNDTNAHYILGNHYQWGAATAGTGETITSETQAQASSSICPKGWRLPTINDVSIGSFQGIFDAGDIGKDVAKLTSSPYYFVRGGDVNQNRVYLFYNAGESGFYWSSTPGSDSSSAYYTLFYGISTVFPSLSHNRYNSYSVRCIAR